MSNTSHLDEGVLDLLERGSDEGCLRLSDVEGLIESGGLDDEATAALFDEIAARAIELRDDCGRGPPEPTYANGQLELRYGIDGDTAPVSLAEAGRRLGLSAERVRTLEAEALERLALEREIAALLEDAA